MKRLRKILPILFLNLILVLIVATNFESNTWLAGWDNLMPELNLGMNIKRSLVAVWQEYQGLGLVGGMAHAADLIRQIILIPLSLLLPANLIRYSWHFAMLFGGTFGIFTLIRKKLKLSKTSAVLGSLYYLLNFGTIQSFWVPFEPFSNFWGFFPWLILVFWQVLEKPNKKNWLKFFLVNLIATPSFYLQTIFLVYLFCLGLITIAFLLDKNLNKKANKIKISFKAFKLLFLANAFWIAPFCYFFLSNLKNPLAGIGNQIASPETFLRSQERGNLVDFLTLKGHYLDFYDFKQPLMAVWQEHFNNLFVSLAQVFIILILITGILLVVLKTLKQKRDFYLLSLIFLLLLGSIAFLSDTIPFSFANLLLRQSSLLNQIFRAPLTKFIVPTIFAFSCFLAIGTQEISQQLKRKTNRFWLTLPVGLALAILFYAKPVFTGNLFYDQMKMTIPQDYFQLIDFFKNKDKNARIANLPQGGFWGWTFYRWGLRGSGFLWYGIEQPILDRAFDVWSLKDEQYYWELNYALQKKDLNLLEQVFTKYQVKYVLFDDNVFFPGEKEYARLSLSTKKLLEKSSQIKKVTSFGEIDLYELNSPTSPFLITQALPKVNPVKFYSKDPAFIHSGHYQTVDKQPDYYYPFFNLFTHRFQPERDFEVEETGQDWRLIKKLPEFTLANDYSFVFDPTKQSLLIPNQEIETFLYYQILREDNQLILKIPKIESPWCIEKTFNENSQIKSESWNETSNGKHEAKILKENDDYFVNLSAQNDDAVLSFNFPNLPLKNGWLIEIDYRWQKGLPPYVYALGGENEYKFFSTKLEKTKNWQKAYFVIPPYSDFDQGISLTLESISFNHHPSINQIKSVKILPFPFELIQEAHFVKTDNLEENKNTNQITYPQNNHFLWLYLINNIQQPTTLVLPQTFDPGWLAIGVNHSQFKLFKHFMVDNWANGWEINQGEGKIIVFFWPQLLEFLGLLSLPVLGFFLFKRK